VNAPTAVACAAFDPEGDAAVAAVQQRLRALGMRVPHDPAHRLHITLSAAVADPDEVTAALADVASRHPPIALRLDHVGTFARGSIVWLGPSRSVELVELQRDVHAMLGARWPAGFGDQVDPAHWMPHCTLARRATRDAADRLRAGLSPLEIRIAALATIVVGGRGDAGYVPLTGAV
jgi:2'-5' RNA ligase